MKYALFTGCVAKGAGRELLTATNIAADRLGISLVDMEDASCCGAGVVHEDNPLLADALSARTFSLAEEMGLDIMTICSTCQGVMRGVQKSCDANPSRRDAINTELQKDTGRQWEGKVKSKAFYQIMEEDYGLEKLASKATRSLKGLKIAPYYGCYAMRPHEKSDLKDPDNPTTLEDTIKSLGAEVITFDSQKKCCGFPILMPNKANSLQLAGNIVQDAKDAGAHFIVTACPLCHLNLDSYQSEIERMYDMDLGLPVLHYSQMVALALGASPEELNLDSHITMAGEVIEPLLQPVKDS